MEKGKETRRFAVLVHAVDGKTTTPVRALLDCSHGETRMMIGAGFNYSRGSTNDYRQPLDRDGHEVKLNQICQSGVVYNEACKRE
ncbi:hypothetical protein OIU77_020563 [Salix suchowensis]|uniref:Uncharacterized protein n=1 Tax=Salix suchowensis TaxID=1278906 RepID=A0ABQ9C6V7_9ROSI|nr:hypothetical protein OIU77_020563 [Salix suchowensis]